MMDSLEKGSFPWDIVRVLLVPCPTEGRLDIERKRRNADV